MSINSDPDIHTQVICSNVFIKKDGKYLVLKRSPLKKYAPNIVQPVGGKVDFGETPYQAAIREAYEETGVKIINLKLEACSLELHPDDDSLTDWFVFYFSADYDSGEFRDTEEGELLLLTAEEFKNSQLFPPLKRMINHILEQKDGLVFATFDLDKNLEVLREDIKVCVL